jgi:hypothetical protein
MGYYENGQFICDNAQNKRSAGADHGIGWLLASVAGVAVSSLAIAWVSGPMQRADNERAVRHSITEFSFSDTPELTKSYVAGQPIAEHSSMRDCFNYVYNLTADTREDQAARCYSKNDDVQIRCNSVEVSTFGEIRPATACRQLKQG